MIFSHVSGIGNKIKQTWDQNRLQLEPIWPGGEGYPKINENMKNKNAAVNNQNENKIFRREMWNEFLKNRRAQRLGVDCGSINKCDKNGI